MNLISVIVPTYNRASMICETLDSIVAQNYRPIELIIVDDGSTDFTEQVVSNWVSDHEKAGDFFVSFIKQENQGASAARNHGFRVSTGEFIQFLDSDDKIHSSRFDLVVDGFSDPDVEFIQTGFEGFCPECREVLDVHYGNPDQQQLDLLLRGRLWGNTLRSMFRRSLLERIGPWNESMICFEDYEFVIRAVLESRKCLAIKKILASARRGGSERVSDVLISREGRKMRVLSEQVLWNGVRKAKGINPQVLSEFASRLYALGFRSNASGWLESGKMCGEMADSLNVKLDALGKRRRIVWLLGKFGGRMYEFAYAIKCKLQGKETTWPIPHSCPSVTVPASD